ncbi:DAPG hydrolase family protein [Streptomyces sp. NPDC020883]|uniref:DAPG hydrolase family protein n=1 Tax=unclassified Streptomyces TaxID=2593676 RepID=UPI0034E2EB11
MLPVTYYPVPTQDLFRRNAERIKNKPYAEYFNGDLWLHDDVLPSLKAPMDPDAMLSSDPADLNTLLDPGHHTVETGYGLTRAGHPYVASLTRFPGCTPEMFTWWFWWHSVEPERYSLWYPYNHVEAVPRNKDVLTRPGLSDAERYIGNTHDIVEYIGPTRLALSVEFVDPAELGLDTGRFTTAGYRAHACARIRGGYMIHLARKTDEGFELRSRYLLDRTPAPAPDSTEARDRARAFAYELLLHDQIEFTHLSTFLADIFAEFGRRSASPHAW